MSTPTLDCALWHVSTRHQRSLKDKFINASCASSRLGVVWRTSSLFCPSSSRFCMSARSRLASAARSSSTTRSSSCLELLVQRTPCSRRHCIRSVNDVPAFAVAGVLAFRCCCAYCPFYCCRSAPADSACPLVHPLRCSTTVAWHCSGRCPTSYLKSLPVFLQRPSYPAPVGRPDPSRRTQSELLMFHVTLRVMLFSHGPHKSRFVRSWCRESVTLLATSSTRVRSPCCPDSFSCALRLRLNHRSRATIVPWSSGPPNFALLRHPHFHSS